MDWKEYFKEIVTVEDCEYEFNEPAPVTALEQIKLKLNLSAIPEELDDLYKQTNGIKEKQLGQVIGEFIWSAEKVIEINYSYRTNSDFKELYMSFDQLLFFSDAGNGDLFGFTSPNGKFDRYDIYSWNHEDDSRTWVAPNLKKYIEWWNNGTIKV